MKELNLQNSSYNFINEFSEKYGIEKKDQVIAKLENTNLDNEKKIILQNGNFESSEPLFIVDDENQTYALLTLASLNSILESAKNYQKENFELKLEKAIYQQVPIDFNDVWAVAMDRIKASKDDINFDKLIQDLKQEYPNLFVNIQAMAERIKKNERL